MRIVLKQGKNLQKYTCLLCGQVEMLSEEEERKCSNCGTSFDERKRSKPVENEHSGSSMKPLWREVPETEPKQRMRSGRRPSSWDENTEVCHNCEKAMKTDGGYTCKESFELVKNNDGCNLFKKGIPVGGR